MAKHCEVLGHLQAQLWPKFNSHYKLKLHYSQNTLSGSISMLSLEILVASDFDKVAGTAIYYLQYYYM